MINEVYKALCSIPEEMFVVEDRLAESVINSLRDPICLNIPNIYCKDSPAECKKCSQVLCAKCVEMIVKADAKCPNCREYLQVRKLNRYLKQIVSNLKIRCHLQASGCEVALPLEELIEHESTCEFDSIQCPKQCGKRVIRKLSDDHLEHECPREFTNCSHLGCQTTLPRESIASHEEVCTFRSSAIRRIEQDDEEKKGFDEDEIILSYEMDAAEEPPSTQAVLSKADHDLSRGSGNQLSESNYSKCRFQACRTTLPSNEIIEHEKTCLFKTDPIKNETRGYSFFGSRIAILGSEGIGIFSNSEGKNRRRVFSEDLELLTSCIEDATPSNKQKPTTNNESKNFILSYFQGKRSFPNSPNA